MCFRCSVDFAQETWEEAAKTAFSPQSEGVGQRWAPDAVRAGRASCAVWGVNSPFLIDLKLETYVLASAAKPEPVGKKAG